MNWEWDYSCTDDLEAGDRRGEKRRGLGLSPWSIIEMDIKWRIRAVVEEIDFEGNKKYVFRGRE